MDIVVDKFSGMIPLLDDQLLPKGNAVEALNSSLYGGNLTGFKADQEIRSLTNVNAKKIFRIPLDIYAKPSATFSNSVWMEFEDPDTDILKSPVALDTFERYYWFSPSTGPRYNTMARISAGQSSYKLGIPQPLTPPDVDPSVTASEVAVTRAYLYTFVSAYGEEGPPSAAVIATGKQDSVWTITVAGATVDQAAERNLERIRIYRTITSAAGVATYFFVDEILINETVYVDTLEDTIVSAQGQFTASTYVGPVADLQGAVSMPNGVIAAWKGQDIFFCQPYLPHAWPAAYGLTVSAPIVGLAVYGQTLVIMTTSQPHQATGINPAVMALSKIDTIEPCLSRASIVTAPEGVYYAGPNGLVRWSPGKVQNITSDLVERIDWQKIVDPWTLRATRYGTAYMAVNAPRDEPGRGVVIDPNNANASYSYLEDDREIQTFTLDIWTNETFVVYGGKVWRIDPTNVDNINPYKWTSQMFMVPFPRALSVVQVDFLVPDGTAALNGTVNVNLEQELASDQYGLIRVWGDGNHLVTHEIRDRNRVMRIPAGQKYREWQFQVEARVIVQRVEIATSPWELRRE